MATVVDDIVVGREDAVGEPVVAHELPDVLDRIELGCFRRQRHQCDVRRDIELIGEMSAGLIEQQNGVSTWLDRPGDFREMQRHGSGVAERQDEASGGAPGRTDGAEDVGRTRPLIVRR